MEARIAAHDRAAPPRSKLYSPSGSSLVVSADSALEEEGFEPSVPGTKEPVFVAEGELRDRTGAAKKGCFLCGTDGSNPSPSSEESAANAESLEQAALISLVEPTTRGDPESPLRWTCK